MASAMITTKPSLNNLYPISVTPSTVITTIHKPGKFPHDPANYHPISLLNADLKFYAKLATRLAQHIARLVQPDQVGFIPHHQASDGTRHFVNLIHWAEHYQTPSLLILLDAGKALDRVHWEYLEAVLRKFGTLLHRLCQGLDHRPLLRPIHSMPPLCQVLGISEITPFSLAPISSMTYLRIQLTSPSSMLLCTNLISLLQKLQSISTSMSSIEEKEI